MKLLLTIFAVLVSNQCRAAELADISAADIKRVAIEEPAPAAAAGMQTYRSFLVFKSRTAAVNAMMNAEANLLRTNVPVFEKRVFNAGGGYSFELSCLSSLRQAVYTSKETFPSTALALNAVMGAEASLLKAGVPAAETRVVRDGGAYRYELSFLAAGEVMTFVPARGYGSRTAALNEMYNTEARLLAGKVGPLEKRVIQAGDKYTFEISYVAAD